MGSLIFGINRETILWYNITYPDLIHKTYFTYVVSQ